MCVENMNVLLKSVMTSDKQKRSEAQNLKVWNTCLFHVAVIHCTQPVRLNVEYCKDSHARTGGWLWFLLVEILVLV